MNKENEICLITMEECSEVIQAISKVQRFGIDGVHPEYASEITKLAAQAIRNRG